MTPPETRTRRTKILNEVPEHMAQEFGRMAVRNGRIALLNEVPEHMAQELRIIRTPRIPLTHVLNEVPEHMAQEC